VETWQAHLLKERVAILGTVSISLGCLPESNTKISYDACGKPCANLPVTGEKFA
jgi:hypothetical protein